MLILKRLTFENIFSYKEKQVIDFTKDRVVLLEGKVGAGKSSIPTILEELLYSKNSRGFAKSDIVNRYSNNKTYKMSLDFSCDEDNYEITKTVASTAKVVLLKNGVNISGHTATQTYEIISKIIGLDFSTFSKLIYQSLVSSMDFLTATDANRKAFLVSLYKLHEYDAISEEMKERRKSLISRKKDLESDKLVYDKTIESNLQLKEEPLLPEIEVPDYSEEISRIDTLIVEARVFDAELRNAEGALLLAEKNLENYTRTTTNLEVARDKFSKELASLENELSYLLDAYPKEPAPTPNYEEISRITCEVNTLNTLNNKLKQEYNRLKAEASIHNCPTCKQSIDNAQKLQALASIKKEYTDNKEYLEELNIKLSALISLVQPYEAMVNLSTKILEVKEKISSTSDKLDKSRKDLEDFISGNPIELLLKDIQLAKYQIENLQSNSISLVELQNTKEKYKSQEKAAQLELDTIRAKNAKILANNAAASAVSGVLSNVYAKLELIIQELISVDEEINSLDVLIAATKDLVSYKLESNVKVFEESINNYLTELSGGALALAFKLDSSKLIVDIYNKGVQVSIKTLSSGQTNMVNIATLLAIRNTMAKISKTHINLLFLDEIVSTLDDDIKGDLINILIKENNLNTILVSHGFSHPLAVTRHVVMGDDGFSKVI